MLVALVAMGATAFDPSQSTKLDYQYVLHQVLYLLEHKLNDTEKEKTFQLISPLIRPFEEAHENEQEQKEHLFDECTSDKAVFEVLLADCTKHREEMEAQVSSLEKRFGDKEIEMLQMHASVNEIMSKLKSKYTEVLRDKAETEARYREQLSAMSRQQESLSYWALGLLCKVAKMTLLTARFCLLTCLWGLGKTAGPILWSVLCCIARVSVVTCTYVFSACSKCIHQLSATSWFYLCLSCLLLCLVHWTFLILLKAQRSGNFTFRRRKSNSRNCNSKQGSQSNGNDGKHRDRKQSNASKDETRGSNAPKCPQRVVDAANVLGVNVQATRAEVNKAYKKLALKFHPDKWRSENPPDGMTKAQTGEHIKKINHARAVFIQWVDSQMRST